MISELTNIYKDITKTLQMYTNRPTLLTITINNQPVLGVCIMRNEAMEQWLFAPISPELLANLPRPMVNHIDQLMVAFMQQAEYDERVVLVTADYQSVPVGMFYTNQQEVKRLFTRYIAEVGNAKVGKQDKG